MSEAGGPRAGMEVECPPRPPEPGPLSGAQQGYSEVASLPSALRVSRSALWGVWREELSSPACHAGCTGQRADGFRVLFWAFPPPARPRPDLEVRCTAGEGLQGVGTLPGEGGEHLSNPMLAGWGALGDAGCVSQIYTVLTGASEERNPLHTPFLESSPLRSLPYLPGGVPVPTQAALGPAGLAWE